jgi:hypothetical protein
MQKFILLFSIISILSNNVYSQERSRMRPKDRLIIGLFTDTWSGLPQTMSTNTINRGVTIDYVQEFPISTSNFSFAAGIGFAGHNLYSDHYYRRFQNSHDFQPIGEDLNYNNKLSLNYLNVPLEFRYRTRNTPRDFRIHAGVKAGLLINAHTKYSGDDPGEPSRKTRLKEGRLDNMESFMLGFHGRIGYGRVNLNTFIPLSNIFKDNDAADARFLSFGLSFIIF